MGRVLATRSESHVLKAGITECKGGLGPLRILNLSWKWWDLKPNFFLDCKGNSYITFRISQQYLSATRQENANELHGAS